MLKNVNMFETLTNVAICYPAGSALAIQAGEPVQRSGSPMTND
ncbi:hypothetical protein NIES2107_12760 [Nostoc carneum NIES-2107]|nr:hypothetical protein NIES2107_12760 [Nostoc carneum NIES-2107]